MGALTGSREPSPDGLGPSGFDPERVNDFPFVGGRCLRLPKWAQREMSKLQCEVIDLEMGAEVGGRVREIMDYWTGTNCTFADDDVTALGILAGHAIRAGLHRDAALPKSLIAAIDRHLASVIEARSDATGTGAAEGESVVAESETPR